MPQGRRAAGGTVVEAVPVDPALGAGRVQGAGRHRTLLDFASANAIYGGDGGIRRAGVGGVPCTVLTADINRLWLGSVRDARSLAPFSPTWLATAYELASYAACGGFTEAVDVGSGDGRIAYCAAALGIRSHSVELSGSLASLQRTISGRTGVRIDVRHADASEFDYASLGLSRPAFFVGGLAQMGGGALAGGAMAYAASELPDGGAMFALPGTLSPKYAADPHSMAGWGQHLCGAGMRVGRIEMLPTAWTLGEADATPYLYARTGPRRSAGR